LAPGGTYQHTLGVYKPPWQPSIFAELNLRFPVAQKALFTEFWNNVVEQDHRRIKQRVRPMLGFKRFDTAAVTIRGIELAEKIKKGQFNLEKLAGKPVTIPAIWTAVLAA